MSSVVGESVAPTSASRKRKRSKNLKPNLYTKVKFVLVAQHLFIFAGSLISYMVYKQGHIAKVMTTLPKAQLRGKKKRMEVRLSNSVRFFQILFLPLQML